MRLEQQGFSEATAYDFDLAVKMMGGAIDAALHETVEVQEPQRPNPPKGSVWTQKPKYRLSEILFEHIITARDQRANGPRDDEQVSTALAALPAARL
jgi:hypothetical protein